MLPRHVSASGLGQLDQALYDGSFPGGDGRHHDGNRRRRWLADGRHGRRRLCALAFNLPTVTVTDEMGPFEIVLGTQTDDIAVDNGMFPASEGRLAMRPIRVAGS